MDKAAIRFTADLSKHYKPLRKTCNCSEDSLHLESFSSYLYHLRTGCKSSQKELEFLQTEQFAELVILKWRLTVKELRALLVDARKSLQSLKSEVPSDPSKPHPLRSFPFSEVGVGVNNDCLVSISELKTALTYQEAKSPVEVFYLRTNDWENAPYCVVSFPNFIFVSSIVSDNNKGWGKTILGPNSPYRMK